MAPLGGRAVVFVGVGVVVVDVQPRQHAAARWTTHRRRYVRVWEGGATVSQDPQRLAHEVHRTCDE